MKQKYQLKYSLFTWLVLWGAYSLFSACESTSHEVTFERKTVSDSLTMSNGKQSATSQYNIDFAYAEESEGDTVATRINQELVRKVLGIDGFLSPTKAVDSYVDDFVKEFRSDFSTFYEQTEELENDDMQAWLNYEIDLHTQTATSYQGMVVNYVADQSSYMGGAHHNYFARWLNFDSQTGNLLTLEQILIPDYGPLLLKALEYELQAKCNAKSMAEVREAGYLGWSELYVPADFLIKDDGILFLYNPYDIAPWYMGSTELMLNNEKLKNVLKPVEEWK